MDLDKNCYVGTSWEWEKRNWQVKGKKEEFPIGTKANCWLLTLATALAKWEGQEKNEREREEI